MRRGKGGSRSIVGTVTSKHGLALLGIGTFVSLYVLATVNKTTDSTSVWYKLGQWTGLKPSA